MAKYRVGKGLRLSYILSLLFSLQLVVLPVAADEEYYSGGAEGVAPPPAADPEVVCRNFLVNVRNDMLTQLATERDRLNGIATCLTSPVDESGTCGEQTAGVLDTLDQYRDYEAHRFLSTVGFNGFDAEALMRTNADFGVENTNTALMGGFAPMTHMNQRFQNGFIGDHVQRFQDAQRPHLAGWWQSNITSERFPNWDRCVATNDSGEVQWDSRDGSALLYPQFLDTPRADDEDDEPVEVEETTEVAEPTDDGPSDLQTDCDALRAFFQNNPQAIDLTRQVATDSEAALLGAENLQPWHGFLDRLSIIDPDPQLLTQLSHEEIINLEVARAHNRLASRFVDFEDHVSHWDDDEIMQLLAFDQIRNSPATEQSCPDMEAPSGFQWGDLLHLIPGYSVVAASLDLRNNYTALVVGANGEQTYWQNHGDTSGNLVIGAAAAVPLAAAEIAAGRYLIGPGMELAEPYVRPALDAAGNVIDGASRFVAPVTERISGILNRTPSTPERPVISPPGSSYPPTGNALIDRPLHAPDTAALERFARETGREVEVRRIELKYGQEWDVITDRQTGEQIFFFEMTEPLEVYQGQPMLASPFVHVAADNATGGYNTDYMNRGFNSYMYNRFVQQYPNVNLAKIDSLVGTNERILLDLLAEGYSAEDAFRATPAFRTIAQNGFTEIVPGSFEYQIDPITGELGFIEVVMRRPAN